MQKKAILIGELILDKDIYVTNRGYAAEHKAPKNILMNEKTILGGTGMVLNALSILKKKTNFFTIVNSKLNLKSKYISSHQIENFSYKLEKKRFWDGDKLIMQLNDLKKSKKIISKLHEKFIKYLKKDTVSDKIILCDYRNGIFTDKFTKQVIKISKIKGLTIYVDQQSTSNNPQLYKFMKSDYLILNRCEYNKAFKQYNIRESNIKQNLKRLSDILKIKNLVVKLGDQGSLIYNKDEYFKVKAYKSKGKVNTIGAGDFYLARFATLENKNSKVRLDKANKFASKKIYNKL